MTCNTEEDDDLCKSNIRLEEKDDDDDDDDDNDDNSRKRLFEEGLGALLADPNFLLLYVPSTDGAKMQIIRPATDSYHRKLMIERMNEPKSIPSFYYTLSHLWGLSEDDQCYWNDISHYVDDENGQPVKPVSMRPEKRDTLLGLLKNHPDIYWWIDVLCARYDTPLSIMGDIYACCLECIVMIDCEPRLISKIHAELDAVEDVKRFMKRFGRTCLTYQQYFKTKVPQLIEPLYTFFQSEWWQRVWTWQEMALPVGEVRFMAETDIYQLDTSTITLNELFGFRRVLETYDTLRPDIEHENNKFATLHEVRRRLRDIYYAIASNSRRIAEGNAALYSVIYSLRYSKRRCYDPCDYVYGVLGMLQIKIPRMSDPNAVWRHFLSELDNLSPPFYGRWMDLADRIDLREVKDIGDVYKKLN